MKRLSITLLLFFSGAGFNISTAQTYSFNKVWEKLYGGFDIDRVSENNAITLDKDSNIIIVGWSVSNVNGNKTTPNCLITDSTNNSDFWILKLDQNGNKFWENTYGGKKRETSKCVAKTLDGCLLIGGDSYSPASCEKSESHFGNGEYWIIKIDTLGQKTWDKRYGGIGDDWLTTLIATPDSGFLLVGSNSAGIGGNIVDTTNGSSDLMVFKIDSIGNIEWNNLYGSSSIEFGSGIIDANNNYVFACTTMSTVGNGDISSNGFNGPFLPMDDNWILKVDANGNKIWDKRYGCANSNAINCMVQNNKGEYLVAGIISDSCTGGNLSSSSPYGQSDILLYTLDSLTGNILFQKRFGGSNRDGCLSIKQFNNGYLLVCKSNSDPGFDKSENCRDTFGYHREDIWLLRLDSAYNVMWDKTIGGPGYEHEIDVFFLNDSCFIVASSSDGVAGFDKTLQPLDTTTTANIRDDIWITKWQITTVTGVEELAQPQFTLYPNPVKDVLYVSIKKRITENTLLSVIDMQGRVVKEEVISQSNSSVIPIDVSGLSQGVYLLRVNGQVQRFVKM